MPSERVCRRLIYSGRVQGVGFRFTAASIARRKPVCGYVRNLPDGTVELVLEGSPAAVELVLSEIADAFRDNIEHVRSEDFVPAEPLVDFQVRR